MTDLNSNKIYIEPEVQPSIESLDKSSSLQEI